MSSGTKAPDPFGFNSQCNTQTSDTQLMTDTFSNIINSTFTFRCCGEVFGCIDQPGPTLHACGDNVSIGTNNLGLYPILTLCIGGIFEQHACAADGCQQIDRSGVISKQCPQQLIQFMKVQPVGSQYACCDSSSCALGNDFTCDSSRSLQICVGDSTGAECFNPSNLAICSGNYSSNSASGSAPGSGSTDQTPGSTPQITAPSSSPSTNSSHSGLGPSDIATIIGSTLGVLTSLIGVWLGYRQIKKRKMRRAENNEEKDDNEQPVTSA